MREHISEDHREHERVLPGRLRLQVRGEVGLGRERAVGQVVPQARVAGLRGEQVGGVADRVERTQQRRVEERDAAVAPADDEPAETAGGAPGNTVSP